MKKFLFKLVIFTAMIAVIILPFNMAVDPYNVFHWKKPVSNGVEPNQNYIKTEYILHNPDKFDSFLFGSSRVGLLDASALTDGHYYNMNSSEAVPAEHLRILKKFAQHGIVPRHVIVMVDEISAFIDTNQHQNVLFRVPVPDGGPLDYIRFYMKYLDTYVTFESLKVIHDYKDSNNPDLDFLNRFYTTGNYRLDQPHIFTGYENDGTLTPGYWNDDDYSYRGEQAVAEIMELKQFCEAQGTDVTILVTPTYFMTYRKSVENGYLDFLDLLSQKTEFYSFAGCNDITMSPENYYETSHFIPEIGYQLLSIIRGASPSGDLLSQGFGVYVTQDNRDSYMKMLNDQLAISLSATGTP